MDLRFMECHSNKHAGASPVTTEREDGEGLLFQDIPLLRAGHTRRPRGGVPMLAVTLERSPNLDA